MIILKLIYVFLKCKIQENMFFLLSVSRSLVSESITKCYLCVLLLQESCFIFLKHCINYLFFVMKLSLFFYFNSSCLVRSSPWGSIMVDHLTDLYKAISWLPFLFPPFQFTFLAILQGDL